MPRNYKASLCAFITAGMNSNAGEPHEDQLMFHHILKIIINNKKLRSKLYFAFNALKNKLFDSNHPPEKLSVHSQNLCVPLLLCKELKRFAHFASESKIYQGNAKHFTTEQSFMGM